MLTPLDHSANDILVAAYVLFAARKAAAEAAEEFAEVFREEIIKAELQFEEALMRRDNLVRAT